MKLNEIIRELRGKESLRDASKRIGISHTYLDTIEKGHDKRSGKPVNPTPETLKLISKAYRYPYKDLMIAAGYIEGAIVPEELNNPYTPPLTEKDEKDIAKRMEKLREDLTSGDGLSFRGEPMSEEAIESLLEAIEYADRQTTRINKKYIPKKYRKDNTDD